FIAAVPAYRLRCLEREAAGKHRQLAKERALGVGEEFMAPLDQGQQCLVAWQGGATPPGQQAEAIIQARRDLFGQQDLRAGGRQLNRQRYTIQTSNNLCDGGGIVRREAKGRVGGGGALDKQAHRVIV